MRTRKEMVRKNGIGQNYFFSACAVVILLASIANSAAAYTIWGAIYNSSNSSNLGNAIVLLNYSDGETPTLQTAITDFRGVYSFNISSYPLNGSYSINASKGDYTTATASRNFPKNISEESRYIGAMTLTKSPVVVNSSCDRKIVNKGDLVNCTVRIEVASGETPKIAGMQVYLQYIRFGIKNVSDGNFFNRKNTDFFNNATDYENRHVIFNAVIGRYNYNESGVFAVVNMTAAKNGTDSLMLDNIKISDYFGSSIKPAIVTSSISVTWPPDVNGDGNVTAADVGRINYCLTMKYTVAQCGEHTDANLDGNTNITAADLGLVRYNLGKSLIREY